MTLDLAALPDLLRAARPRRHRWAYRWRRAAVAVVLRPGLAGPELLLIQRAERQGDPWSGDVALPGGMAGPLDRCAHDVAAREVQEEVGLHLPPPLGRLHEQLAFEPRTLRPMPLTPLVYTVPPDTEVRPDGREVVAARWVPWSVLADPSRRSRRRRRIGPLHLAWPHVDIGAAWLWGLTLRVVDDLAEHAGR